MTRKFTFTILAMLFAILRPGAEAWGEKITTLAGITSGNKYYIGATTSSTDYYFYVDGNATTESIKGVAKTNKTEAVVLTFTAVEGGWTIKFDGGNYLGIKNAKDNGAVQVMEAPVVWTIEENADKGLLKLHPNDYYLQKNNSGDQFGSYKNTQTDVWLEAAGSTPSAELVSIAISGTPNKTTYEAGESFDPAGLVVTGTYDDESTAEITSGITWDVTPNPLTAGTTSVSVTATVDNITSEAYVVDGLTVNAALPKITITADKIANFASSYAEYTWTANDVSGKCWAYRGGSSGSYNIQFNKTTYVYNTTAVPGRITSVKMTKVAGTTRSWSIYGADEALTGDNYTTAGTQIGSAQEVSSETGTTWNVPNDKNYTYFYITKADGSTNIGEIVISYEEDTEPSITADVEAIEFEQKELDETVTDSKVISATGKNLTAPIAASMKEGSDAVFSVVANGTPTAAAGDFTVSYSTTEAGEYAGTVVLSSGETSIEIPVSAKVVAHIPVLQSVAVSGTPTKTSYNEGEEFDPAGLTVTGTYDVGGSQIITEGIEWTVTPSGALTAGTTSVSVTAKVGDITSDAYQVNGLTVTAAQKWAKVTADKIDWSGEYLLVYENEGTAYVWTGVDAADCNAPVTISNNQITKPADAVSLTIASMDGGYSILVNGGTNDGKYIYGTSGSNKINFGTTASLNTIAYPYADGNNSVKIVSNTATMRYNSNSNNNRFRYFGSAGQQNVQLYEKVLAPTNEAVTFAAPTDGTLVIKNGATPISSGATIQNGTVLDVTFGMTPAEAYKDVAIKVTKTESGDDVTSTVYNAETKKITMPRYAITVAVTFTKLYKISLVTDGEGTGSATMNGVTTDIYVDDETQINLVANAVAPNEFTKWSATSNISINEESEAETYALASGDGTITATFGISKLQPLGTPTLSDPTNITYSGVTLNWQELANAKAYNVELLLNDETVASDVIIGETTWTPEVTLQAKTTYTYTVQGVGDGITYAEENNPKATSTFTTDDYPAVVLTLSENGIARNIPGKLNTSIDLPTISTQTCEDKVFVGWSATIIDGETDAEPSLLGETYTFTNPEQLTATIYAVYAKETPGESSNWEITSIDKPGSGSGYTPYNGSHTTDNISYTTSQIMMSSDNKIQFQKNAGYMYNTTPFSGDILFITIADITSNISVYEGSTEITTTPTSGAITLAEGKYTFSKGKKYFHIKMGNATGYSSKITVAVAGAPTYSNYCTTTPIVISGNIAWNNDVTISGNTVTIGSGAVLTVNGALVNTNPANLIIKEGGQLIVNNKGVQATMEKNIDNASKASNVNWYTISSPLAAESTAFANVTNLIPNNDVTNTNYDLYYLDEANGMWINARPVEGQTSDFTTIDKGRGYIYHNNADTELEFKGEINVADVKCTLTNDAAHGFNLIGNPFMQNITLANVTGTAELAGGFYVLTNQNTWGTEPSYEEIKPLQGFLVQATEAGDVTISKPTLESKGERSNEQNTNIEVIVSNSSYTDNAYAMFGEGTGLNKVSHRNAQAPMIYIPQGNEDFAIAFMDENTTVFPVSFKAMTTGKYSISLKATDDISTLVLVDNMTGTETNMLLEDSYPFIGSPADNENRFTVKLGISHSNGQSDSEHFVYQSGNELVINGEGTLQIFDVLGRVVISEEVHGQTVNVGNLSTGAYIVRLTGESVMTQKIVVR